MSHGFGWLEREILDLLHLNEHLSAPILAGMAYALNADRDAERQIDRGSSLARTLRQKGKDLLALSARHGGVHVKSVNIQKVRQQSSSLQKRARNEQPRERNG